MDVYFQIDFVIIAVKVQFLVSINLNAAILLLFIHSFYVPQKIECPDFAFY